MLCGKFCLYLDVVLIEVIRAADRHLLRGESSDSEGKAKVNVLLVPSLLLRVRCLLFAVQQPKQVGEYQQIDDQQPDV